MSVPLLVKLPLRVPVRPPAPICNVPAETRFKPVDPAVAPTINVPVAVLLKNPAPLTLPLMSRVEPVAMSS